MFSRHFGTKPKSKRKAKKIYKKVLQATFDKLADEFTKKVEDYLSDEKNLEKFKKEMEWRQEWEERIKVSPDDFELQKRKERKEFPFATVYDSKGNIVKGEIHDKANQLYKDWFILGGKLNKARGKEREEIIKNRKDKISEIIKIQDTFDYKIIRTR